MSDLREHFNKSQQYLKLVDGETVKLYYVSWEAITTKFGKKGYEFTFEREDGNRIKWTTSNSQAVLQLSDLLDAGLKRGGVVEIKRTGSDKTDTRYTITQGVPF
jgi:uncharacterized protein YajQ (UPF0234 family)